MSDSIDTQATGLGESAFERKLQKGIHLLDIERYDLAEQELRSAVSDEPEDPEARLQLARALLGLGNEEEAESEVLATIQLAPEGAFAHAFLGAIQMDAGRHVEAEKTLIQSLRLDPELAFGYESYSRLMYKTGHQEKAEKLVRRALAVDPDSSAAHGLLGLILGEKGDRQASIAAKQGVHLAPEDDSSHLALGVAFLQTGHPFKARQHLRQALRIDPDPETEELFLEADMCCRLIYLPMYFYELLVDQLPGKQFLLWGIFLIGLQVMRSLGVDDAILLAYVLTYIGICMYTWVAGVLVRVWIRLMPAK